MLEVRIYGQKEKKHCPSQIQGGAFKIKVTAAVRNNSDI
jgi:hypothetical protein